MNLPLFPEDFPVDQMRSAYAEWPGMAPSSWWEEACEALRIYQPPVKSLEIKNKERKWEVVSAYQKSVRRGHTDLALKLVSGMCSMPEELGYYWRRVCVTAAEDVGPSSNHVMNFVLVASSVYTPKKAADYQYKVLCFLTEMMCATERSRAYCMMSIIEGLIQGGVMPQSLTDYEREMVKRIKETPSTGTWSAKNNWRGEGMPKFQECKIHHKFDVLNDEVDELVLLKGLPSYCYDMHTRVGKGVLIRMCGFSVVKAFFEKNPTLAGKDQALGWAMFFTEGGVILQEHADSALALMEQKFVAAKFGWKLEQWFDLVVLMKKLMNDGAVNKLRQRVLDEQTY